MEGVLLDVVAAGPVRQILHLEVEHRRIALAHGEAVQQDVAVAAGLMPVVVQEGQRYGYGAGRQVALQRQRLPFCPRRRVDLEGVRELRDRRHVGVDAGEQPALGVGQQVDLAHDDRAAHLCRVPLGHVCHHRSHVARPLRDAIRVDPAIQQSIVAGQTGT